MFRIVPQCEAVKCAAQVAVHEWRPTAVEPIKTCDAVGARRHRCDGCIKFFEIRVADQSAQPVESIANGGLSGFIANQSRQNASFDDPGDAWNVSILSCVHHMAIARS